MSSILHADIHAALDAIELQTFAAASDGDDDPRDAALFRILQDVRNIRNLVGPAPSAVSELATALARGHHRKGADQ